MKLDKLEQLGDMIKQLDAFIDKTDAALENIVAKLFGDKPVKETSSNTGSVKKRRRMPISLRSMKRAIVRHGWIFLIVFSVWLVGHVGLSFGWMLLCFLGIVYKRTFDDSRRAKRSSINSAYAIGRPGQADSVRDEFLARLGDVPSWVFFADWERAEWLNTIIQRIWPYLNKFVTEFIQTQFADMLRKQTPFGIELRKVDMGDEPLRIGSIKSYNVPNMARDEAILDVEVLYYGDAEFKVSVKALRVGVANLKLRGTIRVTLKPLLSDLPFVGCVTVSFVNRPEIDFDLTEAADLADRLGLHHVIRGAVHQVIDSLLVLPNRLPIRLPVKAVSLNEAYLKHPMPVGVLRVKVIEAKNLPTTDIAIGKMAKCDGFCELSVGNQLGKTRVIQDQANPHWNESFDFTVAEKHGQPLQIIVYDADAFGKKEYVGKLNVDSNDVANAPDNIIDKWFHIYDTTRAQLHLRLTYFNLSDDFNDFSETNLVNTDTRPNYVERMVSMQAARQDSTDVAGGRSTGQPGGRHRHVTANAEHTALAYLFVRSVENLPRSVRDSEPDAKVKITVEEHEVETETVKGCSPRWDEIFHFLVDDAEEAVIVLEVVDKKNDRKTLATGNVKLKHLRNEPKMIWAKPIRLEHKVTTSSLETSLYVTIALRAMTRRKLDATAVADATDGFFLYGAATRRDVSDAEMAAMLNQSIDKKSKKSSASLARSSSKSQLRNSERKSSVALKNNNSLLSVSSVDAAQVRNGSNSLNTSGSVDSPNAADEGLIMRAPQRPIRTSSMLSKSATLSPNSANEQQVANNNAPAESNRTSSLLRVDDRDVLDNSSTADDENSTVLLSTPGILRHLVAVTQPSQPAQFDDADVDPNDAGVHSLGKIKLTFRYATQRSSLSVVVHRCQNLAACDSEKHSSDPYVTLKLVPGVLSVLQRSAVVKNNLSPVFDESFYMQLSVVDLPNSTLLVSVKNHRSTLFSKARKHTGIVALRLKDFSLLQTPSVTAWFDLQAQKMIDSRLSMRQKSRTARSFLEQDTPVPKNNDES